MTTTTTTALSSITRTIDNDDNADDDEADQDVHDGDTNDGIDHCKMIMLPD